MPVLPEQGELSLPKMPKLPQILGKIGSHRKPEEKEYFLALLFWDEGVKTSLWTVDEEKTKVVTLGGWEEWGGEKEDLVLAIDRSLTTCSEGFEGVGSQPDKVVFGLPESWVKNEKIKKEYQDLLQEVCKKLELAPIGFVSTFDAIAFHLKKVEGVPLSAIIIHLAREKISVAVCQLGKISKVEEVVRSGDLAADVCEGLLRFETETLPARMLIFDGKDEMEEARQNLTSFHWQASRASGKALPFLHLPKIEVLPADFDINAVALAGGAQAAKSLGFKITEEREERVKSKEESVQVPVFKEEQEAALPEADLGFVKGRDVLVEVAKTSTLEEKEVSGVLEGEEGEPEVVPVEKVEEEIKRGTKFAFNFQALFLVFRKKLSTFSLPGSGILIGSLAAIILLAGGGFLWFVWYIPKVSVTIFVTPKNLEKELLVTVDPTQEVLDEENFVLPGRLVETEKGGQKEKETTGQKTVGEKAQGEINIYNIGSKKTLPAGTILTGPGGLRFTLDEEVVVASGSASEGRGEAKAVVTADEIGAQYTIASGSKFGVANFDMTFVAAENKSAFTGGSSRQIQAVSKKDQEELLTNLKEELEKEGKDALLASLGQGVKLVEPSVSSVVSKKEFSANVGDEAKNLSLSLVVKSSGITYSEDDFLKLSQKALEQAITADYQLRKEEVETRFELAEEKKDGSYLFNAFLKANLLPKLDKEEVFNKVKGKRPFLAQKYFASLPGYIKSEILFKPRLPSFLQFLPRSPEKISFEVVSY